jgi:hypothetical protein
MWSPAGGEFPKITLRLVSDTVRDSAVATGMMQSLPVCFLHQPLAADRPRPRARLQVIPSQKLPRLCKQVRREIDVPALAAPYRGNEQRHRGIRRFERLEVQSLKQILRNIALHSERKLIKPSGLSQRACASDEIPRIYRTVRSERRYHKKPEFIVRGLLERFRNPKIEFAIVRRQQLLNTPEGLQITRTAANMLPKLGVHRRHYMHGMRIC